MERVDDIAAAFLDALGPLEAKKLEKLVYYAQAWSAASGRGPMFPNVIQAWVQGPVVPYLYQQHRQRWMVERWPSGDAEELSDSARSVVNWVIARYGLMTAAELSALTHVETPWLEARGDLPDDAPGQAPIPVTAMADYYGRQVLSPGEAVRHAVGNAALEGLVVPAEFEEVLAQVAGGERDADEVAAELAASFTTRA